MSGARQNALGSLQTTCAQLGRAEVRPGQAASFAEVTAPCLSAAFAFEDLQAVDEVYEGDKPGFVYSRLGNPTVALLEEGVAALEGGGSALAFSSGMAAIATALFGLLSPGEKVVAHQEIYGGTRSLLANLLRKWGIRVEFCHLGDASAFRRALDDGAKVVFVETITNPLLEVLDVEALAGDTRQMGSLLVVDNTTATPYLAKPLSMGACLVVESLTKYLSGHGDVTGGVLCGSPEVISKVRETRDILGTALDPAQAWLTLRGLRTFPLRMKLHCDNALVLAKYLSSHPKVSKVFYPGLEFHPGHRVAARLFGGRGYGGMVSFEVRGGRDEAERVLRRLKRVNLVPSFGNTATTVSHPYLTSHRGLSPEEKEALGITEGLIRVSVGIESSSDIVEDFQRALG